MKKFNSFNNVFEYILFNLYYLNCPKIDISTHFIKTKTLIKLMLIIIIVTTKYKYTHTCKHTHTIKYKSSGIHQLLQNVEYSAINLLF